MRKDGRLKHLSRGKTCLRILRAECMHRRGCYCARGRERKSSVRTRARAYRSAKPGPARAGEVRLYSALHLGRTTRREYILLRTSRPGKTRDAGLRYCQSPRRASRMPQLRWADGHTMCRTPNASARSLTALTFKLLPSRLSPPPESKAAPFAHAPAAIAVTNPTRSQVGTGAYSDGRLPMPEPRSARGTAAPLSRRILDARRGTMDAFCIHETSKTHDTCLWYCPVRRRASAMGIFARLVNARGRLLFRTVR